MILDYHQLYKYLSIQVSSKFLRQSNNFSFVCTIKKQGRRWQNISKYHVQVCHIGELEYFACRRNCESMSSALFTENYNNRTSLVDHNGLLHFSPHIACACCQNVISTSTSTVLPIWYLIVIKYLNCGGKWSKHMLYVKYSSTMINL